MKQPRLTFLKLGGSLITDKGTTCTANLEVIQKICFEIASAIRENPDLSLVIGHGSGSFGHAIAHQYQTQMGGTDSSYWQGFSEVWSAARELNQIMIRNLVSAGLPVIAFPPSAGVIAENKIFKTWDTQPIRVALSHNLIPVVQGDVVFDTQIGGTIFSTEKVFQHLTDKLSPDRILLAGSDPGVYHSLGQSAKIAPLITPENIIDVLPGLSGAKDIDVTGGMLAKVELMLSLVKNHPDLKVQIFSGLTPGNIQKALAGAKLGTEISR